MKQSMRGKVLLGLCGVLVLGGVGYGAYWLNTGRYLEATDNAYVEADIVYVAPKVEGYVQSVLVKDNQPVKQGDVLLVLDDKDYRSKVAEAEARLLSRRGMGQSVVESIRQQELTVRELAASLAGARADAERAVKDRQRYADLARNKWVSTQRLEMAVADARKAEADVAEAEAKLAAARQQLNVLHAQTQAVGGSAAEAQALLEEAKLNLSYTVIRAPYDGVIGNRTARVGQFVRPGTAVMALVPLSGVYVVANYKETQLERVAVGQPVELHVDAYPDAVIRGHVDSIAPASGSRFSLLPPENATGNFTKIVQRLPVKIAIDQPMPKGVRLTPGMSVVATINTKDARHG